MIVKSKIGRFAACWVFVGVALIGAEVRGGVLFSEDFSYPDGGLVANSGGLWVNNTGTGPLSVLNGAATVTSAQSEDVIRSLGSTFSTGAIYFSIVTTFSVVPTATGSYFAHFADSDSGALTDFIARLHVKAGATPNTVLFGIRNSGTSGTSGVFDAQEFALNQKVVLIVKFDYSTLQSTLWINPVDESSPSITDTQTFTFVGGDTSISRASLRQAGGIGAQSVDSYVTGTTFADVFVAVPEPGTITMIIVGLGAVLWGVGRRRAW
ncbi:MAG: PEP-CTERM sorting domain-containing protein [Terrimicrobiaceae bacterium]|nr:PEP-CTERM sorting domain-containing protein [Terrimicrobiaceae bacterium]